MPETVPNIAEMFSRLAQGYRRFNAFSSLGFHHYWRKKLLAAIPPGAVALDVGTGTGEVPRQADELSLGIRFVGIDVSLGMLSLARRFYPEKYFLAAGGEALPFSDESFDAVVSAYVLRNLQQGGVLEKTLREVYRVLKPEGVVCFLDLTRPSGVILKAGHALYNRLVLPGIGRLVLGRAWPGSYLKNSIRQFLPAAALSRLFGESGFSGFRVDPLTGGIVSLFHARKCQHNTFKS